MERARNGFVFGLLICLCFFAGCSAPTEKSATRDAGRRLVDSRGVEVIIPNKPQKIVSLNIASDEILLDLVAVDRIAALTYHADNPAISNIVEAARQVPMRVRADAETIVSLRPDLVLIPDWQPADLAQSLRDAGVVVYVFSSSKSVAEVQKTIREIAEVVGERDRGEVVIGRMDAVVKAVQAKVGSISEPDKQIVARVSTMGGSGGKGTSFDDICRLAGVRNAGAMAGLGETDALTQEQLIKIDPDVFLLPTWDFSNQSDLDSLRRQIQHDPALQSIKAIKNRRLLQISDRALFCTSQYIVEAVRQLAKEVYPGRFAE